MDEFNEAWLRVQDYTMLGAERGAILWEWARTRLAHVPGEFVELGVYKGGSALLLHAADPTRRLHLFDTFTGHPDGDRSHDCPGSHPPGRFGDVDLHDVVALFDRFHHEEVALERRFHQPNLSLYVGEFPASMPLGWMPKLALVHVDADLYWSVFDACRTFWPWISREGVMIFDDYGFPDCRGARQAVDEWYATLGDGALHSLDTGQAVLVKVR